VILFHHRYDRTDAELDALGAELSDRPDVSLAVQGSTIEL